MKWRLRRAAPEDADALSIVACATFLESYGAALDGGDLVSHCLEHNAAARFRAWIGDPGSIVSIAEFEPGHAPLGYTVLTAADFPVTAEPGDIELRRIYALAQAHGSGLGGALMERAIEDARRIGARRMLLGVWDQNARALAFYRRRGFTVIGTRPFRVGTLVHDDPIYARAI